METLILSSLSVGFVLAVLEQLADIRRFKAVISLGSSVGIVLSMGVEGPRALWIAMSAAFVAPFLVALADRLTSIPLAVTRALGQTR